MRGIALAAIVACGCGGGGTPTDPKPAAAKLDLPPAPDLEALQRIHTEALERAVGPTERALAQFDPWANWEIGQGPLAPPPRTPTTVAPILAALREGEHEIAGIDDDVLSPVRRVQYEALHVGLHRIDEVRAGHPPTRRDPTYLIWATSRILDAVDQARAAGELEGIDAAVRALAVTVTVQHRDLGAASAESLDRAVASMPDLIARADRVAIETPALATAAGELSTALAGVRDALVAQRDALPDTADITWSAWPRPAAGRPALSRLPARLGADALATRLATDEALERPVAEAVPQLLQMIEYLDGIAARFAEVPPPTPAQPFDAARCEDAIAKVRAGLEADATPPAELDCAALARRLGPAPRTDAQLLLDVYEAAIVEPQARARRSVAPKWIALQSGRTAPASHRLAKPLAFAVKLGDAAVVAEALSRTRDAVCRANAAVWIHAELPDRDKLDAWLSADCPGHTPAQWEADVLADPRGALDGLALTLVGTGPAGVTMLELVPWAPLGLAVPVAKPYRDRPEARTRLKITGQLLAEEDP